MNIEIKGHSGCNIEIIENEDNLYIKKSTYDEKYIDRLIEQATKQANDYEWVTKNIHVPKIHDVYKSKTSAYMVMDYIYAKSFVDYFEYASIADIDNFINSFIEYIENELSRSNETNIDKNIFINKFNSVKNNCLKNTLLSDNKFVTEILNRCEKIFNNIESFKIPIGICHGDLTFSNILFTNNGYYFIDYLDSFIETPLQDIVKLRQDTTYFWSTLMYNGNKYDSVRLHMIFEYIDNKINSYFSKYEFYNNYYDILQIMNILRILPYVNKEQVRDFVINILLTLTDGK